MTVTVRPMPVAYRKIPKKFRLGHPPIFDGEPTEAETEEARALLAMLDRESQEWYGGAFQRLKVGK